MTSKAAVKAFYESDLANDPSVVERFFHKDCKLHWTNNQGIRLLEYNDIIAFFEGTRQSYNHLRFGFTHFIEAESFVTTRHTLYGTTIENPNIETMIAHFSTIWEVKDNKLYRGYEISQHADESDEKGMESYKEINI
ncbi:nuclear transport factor 2 family protein [Winogradskyella sediminis]|uniref:nuclear transport factor 2 family protein n=1 Tax=Winogradskyella sediminis TaxID=1382466 RepID=UPI003AA92DF2